MIPETVMATLGGGLLGAGVKLAAGLLQMWLRNKQEDRNERIALASKQVELKKLGPDPRNAFVSWTRRALALSVCWTFCAVALLWAVFPSEQIVIPFSSSGFDFNFLFFSFSRKASVEQTVSTGAIVWSMIPFISMVMATYFTPNLSK